MGMECIQRVITSGLRDVSPFVTRTTHIRLVVLFARFA
ncbi:hypothetical protein Aros01_03285 [Streptosporangium roseum]